MTSQTLSLNLIPKGVCPRLYVSQYDKGQEWNFDIYAGTETYTIPDAATVKIQGTKPDKTGFQYSCTKSGNRVTATEQQQMTIIAGEVPAEIRIEKNNEIIATLNFIIAVEKAALADDTVISETDLPLIEEAIEVLGHADELVSEIQGYVSSAETAATNAGNSATAAAGSASTASTKASQASTSASNAATSASNAASSASTASTKASEAASSASTASTKASEAAGSANTASTKASEAAASAQAAAQSAAHLIIDNAMSTTSENALQNKVVSTAIQNLSTVISKNGAKNLLPFDLATVKEINPQPYYSWSGNVCTTNTGLTITVETDKDGNLLYVDVNGTASANTSFMLALWSVNLEVGDYLLSGCTGGSQNSYRLYANDSQYIVNHNNFDGDTAFTVTPAVSNFNVRIHVGASTVMNHVKFYPMIRLASDTDPTYQPYAKTNVELTADSLATIDNRNILGAKNLCPNTAVSTEINNVVWTVNSDGTVTANGTLTANNSSVLVINTFTGNEVFVGKNVIVSGSPSGGGDTTHRITAYRAESVDGSSGTAFDTGSGVTVNWKNNGSGTKAKIQLEVLAGNEARTISNLTFKPMIRLASDTNPTYEPYAKTNQQLTKETTGLIDNQKVNGAVNLLPNTATSQVINGVTFTVNNDGSITVNGTATAATRLTICTPTTLLNLIKKYTRLKITGCPSGGSNSSYNIYCQLDGTYPTDYGDGRIITGTQNSTSTTGITLQIVSGATVSNLTFKPMLSVPELKLNYNDYVPYAKSNKELTEDVEKVANYTDDGINNNYGLFNAWATPSFMTSQLSSKTILEIFNAMPPTTNSSQGSTIKIATYNQNLTLFNNIGNLFGITIGAGVLEIIKWEPTRGLVNYSPLSGTRYSANVYQGQISNKYKFEGTEIT